MVACYSLEIAGRARYKPKTAKYASGCSMENSEHTHHRIHPVYRLGGEYRHNAEKYTTGYIRHAEQEEDMEKYRTSTKTKDFKCGSTEQIQNRAGAEDVGPLCGAAESRPL